MKQIESVWTPKISKLSNSEVSRWVRHLENWFNSEIEKFENGEVAGSTILVAYLASQALPDKRNVDWAGIIQEHLMLDGKALAYSEIYGQKLYKFDDQWQQFNVNSAYACWFIHFNEGLEVGKFVDQIAKKRQAGGLYFDQDTSPTTYRHRMKSEIAMSTAMSLDVLTQSDALPDSLRKESLAALVDPLAMPVLNYLSYEYFRSRAVFSLDPTLLDRQRIETLLTKCAQEIEFGWSDFVMSEKTNDYMGTATRVSRDKNIHSPLLGSMASWLMDHTCPEIMSESKSRLEKYVTHLGKPQSDIPAFKMRDLQFDFGSSVSGIELISATYLTSA